MRSSVYLDVKLNYHAWWILYFSSFSMNWNSSIIRWCTRNTHRNVYDLLMKSVSQCDIYIVYKVHYIFLKVLICETLILFNFCVRPEGSKAVESNIVLFILLEGEVYDFWDGVFQQLVRCCGVKGAQVLSADAVCFKNGKHIYIRLFYAHHTFLSCKGKFNVCKTFNLHILMHPLVSEKYSRCCEVVNHSMWQMTDCALWDNREAVQGNITWNLLYLPLWCWTVQEKFSPAQPYSGTVMVI